MPDEVMLTDGEDVTVVIEERREEELGGGPVFGGGTGEGTVVGTGAPEGGGGSPGGSGPEGSTDSSGTEPIPPEGRREHEEGQVLDEGRVTGVFRIDRIVYPDGSTTWSRSGENTDGSHYTSSGGRDGLGNSSATESFTYADGTGRIVTRTEDPNGHGQEQVTWIDANGNPTGEETTTF